MLPVRYCGTVGLPAQLYQPDVEIDSLNDYSRRFCFLPPTKKDVNVFARVCLSVCLLARLLKNACMDLDEMLRVDRCRDIDELIVVRMLSPISYKRCNAELYYVGKIPRIRIGRSSLQRRVVLKWFYSPRAVGTPLSEVYMCSTESPSSSLLRLSF